MRFFGRLLFAIIPFATLAAGPSHSQVETKVIPEGEVLRFDFKITYPQGLHLNREAPWKLELTSSPSLKFNQTVWDRTALDDKLPGFHAKTTAKPNDPKGTLSYTLTAFVCTDDKSQCFRDVLKGEINWNRP